MSLFSGSLSATSLSPRACLSVVCELCFSEFLYSLILLLGCFFSLNYYNIFIILYWFLLFSFPPSFKFIIIINVCFRFFVFLASSCRGCLTILHDERTTTKKRRKIGGNNSLSLCAHRTQTRRKRGLFLVVLFSVCVPSGLAVSVCVCVLRPFVVDFGCFRGHGCLCVCFLSQARARSLTFGSLTLSLSRSVSLSPLFLSLALSLSDLHLSLITFTRKYYLLLCFVLLPLICNNSCILRDATVCVCCCCVQYRKGRFALFACLPAACVYGFVCFCGVVIFFYLQ